MKLPCCCAGGLPAAPKAAMSCALGFVLPAGGWLPTVRACSLHAQADDCGLGQGSSASSRASLDCSCSHRAHDGPHAATSSPPHTRTQCTPPLGSKPVP